MMNTIKLCKAWKKSKTTNPQTKRKIKQGGNMYKKINEECNIKQKHCNMFKKDPIHHPITRRQISLNAKKGKLTMLKRVCKPGYELSSSKFINDIVWTINGLQLLKFRELVIKTIKTKIV